ncbi:MAG: hypothetical protein HY814_14035 [Candidatus Riflebacteria bacterium]|nr:hypothetical protein [Candidatus Riflebacteria bacterium]
MRHPVRPGSLPLNPPPPGEGGSGGISGLLALVLFLLAFASCTPVAARPRQAAAPTRLESRDVYRVNAQFRGAVKKSFTDLGELVVSCSQDRDGDSVVTFQGDVRDPDDSRVVYRFDATVRFARTGSSILAAAADDFSEDAQEYRDRILEIAPFVRILQDEPAVLTPQPMERAYRVNGKEYSVHWAAGERSLEATLYGGLRTLGKFFFVPGTGRSPHRFEKFRVNTDQQAVLSFVRQ